MSDQFEDIVTAALDDVASLLPPGTIVETTGDFALLGTSGGPLDSLGLVNLMVTLESHVAESLGKSMSLAESLAFVPEESPYRTPATLAQYLREVVNAGDL